MNRALLASALLALAFSGCFEAATHEDPGPDPARGQCRTLAEGAVEPLLLVRVLRIAVNNGSAEVGPAAGVQVNATLGASRTVIGGDVTDTRGCVAIRLQGGGVYEATSADGTAACRSRGNVGGATDGKNHLELTLRLEDPCA